MSITASWLTASQIDIVIQALKELADASVGLQTCYSIVDWLEANLLSHLNIKHVFQIPAEEDHPSEHKGKAIYHEQKSAVRNPLEFCIRC